MTLSPAAQKILLAFWEGIKNIEDVDEFNLAASFRAAADQLDHATSAHTLYAIADELEAQS
jgi:hypothetical protein